MHFVRASILLLASLLLAVPALADSDSDSDSDPKRGRSAVYEVAVTNVTRGQTFTPILVATHAPGMELFRLGQAASPELEILAEDGMTGPLGDVVLARGGSVETLGGLLEPGQTATTRVHARRGQSRISVAAMLIPTNDTFFAVNAARLPRSGSTVLDVPGYDAGTEENDQHCDHIPGPVCGGQGLSEEPGPGDEGYVAIGSGFHVLDPDDDRILGPVPYDWRNPVARVTVRRVH